MNQQKPGGDGCSPPFFSLVVPTIGREPGLERCLRALRALEYPADRYEIIVVADGVDVSLPADLLGADDGAEIRLLRQPHSGPATARNLGARNAEGAFIAFTDDDCEPHPDWLTVLAEIHQRDPEVGVGGLVVNGRKQDRYAEASQLLVDYVCEYFNRDLVTFLTSNNLSVPRARFLDIGGFDETFPLAAAEDRELCDRWVHGGRTLLHAKEARVDHHHELTLASFCRQHFAYGRGAFSHHSRRATRSHEGIRVEPVEFYANLLRYPARRGHRGVSWSALMLISQVANAAGFFREVLGARLERTAADRAERRS